MTSVSFFEELASLRAASCHQLPTPQLAVLARATARLRRSGMVQKILQPGETAPNFQFIDNHNQQQSLYGLLASGPVVLNFFRGFWCAFCRTELEAHRRIVDELNAQGCHYLAVSPQQAPENEPAEEISNFVFDKQNQIARAYHLVYELKDDERALLSEWEINLDQASESGGWNLPIPATYLIDQDKTVAFQYADADFRDRCCPEELLTELHRLQPRS